MSSKASKFSIDSIYNLLSVGVGGVLFILMNAVILSNYGDKVLGIFNMSYAIYMVLAQVAIFGVHLSVQMHIPSLLKDTKRINESMTASLLLAIGISVAVVLCFYPFTAGMAGFFDMPGIENGLNYCLWGMVFFSINKVLMAYLNGLRKMKAYALFTFLRLFFMFAFVLILFFYKIDPTKLTLLFALTEVVLFVLLIIYTLRFFRLTIDRAVRDFIKEHFSFGRQAFIGNLFLDINTRVDIIMLGYLTTEGDVGNYSFVLAVSQGILQIPVVFRNNINPVITKASVMKNVSSKLSGILKKNIAKFYKVIGLIAFTTIVIYPVGLYIIGIKEQLMLYWSLYAILVFGIILSAGYQPFSMLFNQLKLPKVQSYLFFMLFITNLISNYIFIKWLGIYGAAIGTAISYIAMVFFIRGLARKHCDLKI